MNGEAYATLAEAKKAGAATLNYGLFINAIIDFIIVGFAIFMVVKMANRFQKKEEAAAPSTKACPECLTNIPLAARKCSACGSAQAT